MALSKTKALAIARSVVLPGKSDQVRISDGFGASKTAVAAPYIDVPHPYKTSGTNSYAALMMFRDPFRNYIYYDPNTANSNSKYVWMGNWDTPQYNAGFVVAPGATIRFTPDKWDIDPVQTYQPHGERLYCGSEDRVYTWIDRGCTVTFHVASDTAAVLVNTAFIIGYYWRGENGQVDIITAIPATAADGTFTITPSYMGYYAFEAVGLDGANTTTLDSAWITGYGSAHGVWCHRAVPGLEDNITQTKSLRQLGIATTFRNTTAQQYLNGQACVALMGKGSDPLNIMDSHVNGPDSSLFQAQSAVAGSTVRSFKDSFYVYVPPLQMEDLDFFTLNPSVLDNGNSLMIGTYPMKPLRSWIIVTLLVSAPDTGVPGTSSQFRLEESVEFCSLDTWKTLRRPEADEEDAQAACKAVARIPYVFADPTAALASDVEQLLLSS